MEDKRKKNGGHSTKSKSGLDKRVNTSKKDLEQYKEIHASYIELEKVLNKIKDLALAGDMKAAALWLSYILGKPIETKDVKVELNKNFPDWLNE